MRTFGMLCAAAALIASSHLSLAQSTAPAAPDAGPPGAPAPQAAPPPAGQPMASTADKRKECKDKATAQGLRGQAAKDSMVVCMQEARLDCTKQAVAQQVGKVDRKDFMRGCLGRPDKAARRDQPRS